jgi:hypothetical protein
MSRSIQLKSKQPQGRLYAERCTVFFHLLVLMLVLLSTRTRLGYCMVVARESEILSSSRLLHDFMLNGVAALMDTRCV